MSKLRQAAKGQSCVRCGVDDGTVVLAHYFGPRRHLYGGGMSRKGHDLIGAHLCSTCHHMVDIEMRDHKLKYEYSEQFLHYCALTIIRLYEQGVIKT